MHIKSVGAAVALALLSTTAMAADLPSRRAPPVYVPPPLPVFSWTGPYIGVQAGYGFGHTNGVAYDLGVPSAAGGSKQNGFIGGGHIGYNFSTQSIPVLGQFASGFGGAGGVIGIEGDVDGSTQKANYGIGVINDYASRPIQGSIRGRLGFAVDRALFYATGGAAFGDLRNTYSFGVLNESASHTRVGYTVGGGVEYAVSNNVSIRAEYRYTDFGSYNDVLGLTGGTIAVRHHDTDQRVQAGVSYKFDFLSPVAPVVARY